jgi:hypothetical protein
MMAYSSGSVCESVFGMQTRPGLPVGKLLFIGEGILLHYAIFLLTIPGTVTPMVRVPWKSNVMRRCLRHHLPNGQ